MPSIWIVEKIIRKFNSHEEADAADLAYYRSLSPLERLQILFELVSPDQDDPNAPQERLQRVYRVVKRGGS